MASKFRFWFEEYLRPLNGRRVEWPQLFRRLVYQEFRSIRQEGVPYTGPKVFIDRDDRAWSYRNRRDQHREDLCVYRLYRQVHEQNEGVLSIGEDDIWLVSCKVPNQSRHGTRAADLVGLRPDGSLVVFECKVASNRNDSPLYGLLEGLDYLGHLLIDQNFARFAEGLDQWRLQHGQEGVRSRTPEVFREVVPAIDSRHGVMVLAPNDYYTNHREDRRGIEQGWQLISDRFWPDADRVIDLDFCTYEFPLDDVPCCSGSYVEL